MSEIVAYTYGMQADATEYLFPEYDTVGYVAQQ